MPSKSNKATEKTTVVNLSPGNKETYRKHPLKRANARTTTSLRNLDDIYAKGLIKAGDIKELDKYLTQWEKMLAPGGMVFLIMPIKGSYVTREIKNICTHLGFHVRSMNAKATELHLKLRKKKPISTVVDKKGFIWTSAYGGCWPEKCLRDAGMPAVVDSKIKTLQDFRSIIKEKEVELLIMGNFIADRHEIRNEAIRQGIPVVHGEDGFIPHYSTLHADPTGFCWESSLTRMAFDPDDVVDYERDIVADLLYDLREKVPTNTYSGKPYVLLPLQLIGDRVNKFGLNISGDWSKVINHARACVPAEYDIVVKPHPRGSKKEFTTYEAMAKRDKSIRWVPKGNLHQLINESSGVIGMNSTVLTEARLIFNKPVWAYGKSWYTNHIQLVYPVCLDQAPRKLIMEQELELGIPKSEFLGEYCIWYIKQLLSRQYVQKITNKEHYRNWLMKRTYQSYADYGVDIFTIDRP